MKKTILMTLMLAFGMTMMAQKTVKKADQKSNSKTEQKSEQAPALKPAQIKFDKIVQNFGKFSEKTPVQSAVFTFTNVGEQPLVVNQATAACGCTVPEFTATPVQPGEQGTIKVTYNGEGMFYGPFKKSITVRTNGEVQMTRLYIEGEMVEEKK